MLLRFLFRAGIIVFSVISTAAQESYATAGALQHEGKWEIGVAFNVAVDPNSVTALDNYQLAAAQLESLTFVPQATNVVLTTSGLMLGSTNVLTVSNITDAQGTKLNPLNLSFTAKDMSWVAVGGQELGFTPAAVAVGDTGFNLVSGGMQLFDRYDETTFAYESVEGDFEAIVRVEHQDASSIAAKAGLMVRESLDAGKPRPQPPFKIEEAFSRYVSLDVNPARTVEDQAGANTHSVNFRPYTGGIGSPNFDPTENPPLTNNAAPLSTNAWLRIKRNGQSFAVFRGTNGVDWAPMGQVTFPSPALPQTLFVGPHYSPENGNISFESGLRAAFLARFRDYKLTATPSTESELDIRKLPGAVEISWTGGGTLQGSTNLLPNSWVDLPGVSPRTNAPTGSRMFFRVRLSGP